MATDGIIYVECMQSVGTLDIHDGIIWWKGGHFWGPTPLEEHHIWNNMMWLHRSSTTLPSNFGMSNGSLVGIEIQVVSCQMGSLVSLAKYGRFRLAIKRGLWVVKGCEPTSLVLGAYEVRCDEAHMDG